MIRLYTLTEIEKIRKSAQLVSRTLGLMAEKIEPGVITLDLDNIAEEYIRDNGGAPSFKGFEGFPSTLCTSRNEEVVHGIPSRRELRDGDIVSIDCGTILDGYWGDHARTFAVGEISNEKKTLMKITEASLYAGIEKAVIGGHLSDIGNAVQNIAEKAGYSVVRSLVGHGVGQNLHEEPQVPNYGKAGRGLTLKQGLVIAIEPMINIGSHEVFTEADGWTIITKDRKTSAHFEHTIAITENGPEILTNGQ